MAQAAERHPISDFLRAELELDRKFSEHIKKLNESSTISYQDEAGYWVTRTPEGVVTRIKQIRKVPERPLALFYAGPNGSGKSTLRELDDDRRIQIHIDTDAIALAMNAGNAQAADLSAGREALRRFKAALASKTSFSMETTLSGASVLKRMADSRTAGFEVALRYVALDDPDENVARVADRVARGGHHIPEAVIRRRYTDSMKNLPRAVAMCDRAIIRDNSGTYAVTHLVIENDAVERQTANPPQWIVHVEVRIAQALVTRRD